jgi:hypothetical protein
VFQTDPHTVFREGKTSLQLVLALFFTSSLHLRLLNLKILASCDHNSPISGTWSDIYLRLSMSFHFWHHLEAYSFIRRIIHPDYQVNYVIADVSCSTISLQPAPAGQGRAKKKKNRVEFLLTIGLTPES